MKFWEMISIFRDDLLSLEGVLKEDDFSGSILKFFREKDELVRIQNRQILDMVLPESLSIKVMQVCKLKFCIHNGYLQVGAGESDSEAQMTASDVYARFGAAAIEDALEYGNWRIVER